MVIFHIPKANTQRYNKTVCFFFWFNYFCDKRCSSNGIKTSILAGLNKKKNKTKKTAEFTEINKIAKLEINDRVNS